MKRRLYYLFPDTDHGQNLPRELSSLAIPSLSVHTVVHYPKEWRGGGDVHSLNEPDRDFFLEWFLWRMNLAIFFLALLVLVAMLVLSPSWYLLVPLGVMVLSFALGLVFSLRIPNVHQDEFRDAVSHGEVLMMVDVPPAAVSRVDHHIHRLHPEAVTGGVGWAA
ncbi:MAG: hypothetical protein GC149_02980 [Gammaproteobacteria bacterium]|nr:hypothetical protein [Gammaproteobacteria bacterium]